MLAFRRIPACMPLRCAQRNFFPFFGLNSLFEELNHGYSVGPHVAVKSAKDHVALEFEVPRFKSDEIKVSTGKGTLTVTGKKAQDPEARHRHHLYGDASASSFERTFAVPRGLDLSKMKTDLEHGVFTVTIPKVQVPEEEKLAVESKSAESEEVQSKPEAEGKSEGKQTQEEGQSDASKSESALQTKSESSALIQNLSRMSWPPKVQVSDSASDVKYTVTLPEGVTADNLDLRLQGRYLNVTVNHAQRIEKKNRSGQVVFSEQQSVSYSTPVVVPEGTRAADIRTTLEKGTLTITVTKQRAEQAVKVN